MPAGIPPNTMELLKSLIEGEHDRKQVWIEAWVVWDRDRFSWRAELHEKPTPAHKRVTFWKTHHLLVGKRFIVSFYSNDGLSRETAVSICDQILSGRVRVEEIDLKQIGVEK